MTKTKNHAILTYLDANNLYGYTMSQKLSLSDFEWEKIC